MVFGPVKELNAAGERMYSELHTVDWWWNTQVGPDPTEAGVVCPYPFHHVGIIYMLISYRKLFPQALRWFWSFARRTKHTLRTFREIRKPGQFI
jgi:hypothetical protein